MGKKRKSEGWKVNSERPEEVFGNPQVYYTDEEVERYNQSGGMKRSQEKIAHQIIELLNIKEGKLLDLGCGTGYTCMIYKQEGFQVIGLDVVGKMLEKARDKGLEAKEGDMRNLKDLFGSDSFDIVVSASALQWLKEKTDLKKVAEGINYVLKERGRGVIQFYPKSEEEMMAAVRMFEKSGFDVELFINNPRNPMKRIIFLILRKVRKLESV